PLPDALPILHWTPTDPTLPVAGFTWTAEELTVTSTNTPSDDGDSLTYAWDFGDGNSSTEENPVHTSAADGSYTVTLPVTDGDANTDTHTATVDVEAIPDRSEERRVGKECRARWE